MFSSGKIEDSISVQLALQPLFPPDLNELYWKT